MRLCTRCEKPACEQRGHTIAGRLCREHAAERRKRQENSRSQPNCRCGGKLPYGESLCRRCVSEREEREAPKAKLRNAIETLRQASYNIDWYPSSAQSNCKDIDEVADYLETLL